MADEINNAVQPAAMDDMAFDAYIDSISEGGDAITQPDDDSADNNADEQPDEASTDEQSAELPSEPQEDKPDDEQPFKIFKNQSDYQSEIDRIINKRFKSNKELEEALQEFYGTQDSKQAITLFKRQLAARKAEEQGIDIDEYNRQSEMSKKAKAYDEEQSQREAVAERRKALFAEEAEIKKADESFDLQKLYDSDSKFKEDLLRTGSVYYAYMQHSKVAQVDKAQADKPKDKPQRSFREGGTAQSAAGGKISTSAADLPQKDFEDYIKKIINE